jgi:tol-pal system protein YbgF
MLRALRATAIGVALVAATGCVSGERAQRERDVVALKSQIEELRKGQEANVKELARLSGETKALDAQQAFVVAATKSAGEELARVKAVLEESNKTVRELRSSVDDLSRAAAATLVAKPAPSSPPDASPEQIYAAAMAAFQAEEQGQAVLEFTELTKRFPEHPLASNAQYWIGEAYYRQRDFRQALVEFQKVIDGYPKSSQVPEALLKIGLCYRALKDPPRARETWEQVSREYPGTTAATQARSLLATPAGSARPAR